MSSSKDKFFNLSIFESSNHPIHSIDYGIPIQRIHKLIAEKGQDLHEIGLNSNSF